MTKKRLVLPGKLTDQQKARRIERIVMIIVLVVIITMGLLSHSVLSGIRETAAENIGRQLMTPGK